MVGRIVGQLAQANENLTANVLKTSTANKIKEQIYMHEDCSENYERTDAQ